MDNYFKRPEVSNSDLSWLKKYWMPDKMIIDYEKAYKFGSLIDAMITERHRLHYFNFTVDDIQYTKAEFERAEEMKKAFMRDPFCANIIQQSSMQEVMGVIREIDYRGFKFSIAVRCKWDMWMMPLKWGGDIKSTVATTQKQFEEAVRYFDYDRQRAWYMDIAQALFGKEYGNQDMLIGISKENYKIFKVPIKRGDALYKSGLYKYEELAFRYWYLFGDYSLNAA